MNKTLLLIALSTLAFGASVSEIEESHHKAVAKADGEAIKAITKELAKIKKDEEKAPFLELLKKIDPDNPACADVLAKKEESTSTEATYPILTEANAKTLMKKVYSFKEKDFLALPGEVITVECAAFVENVSLAAGKYLFVPCTTDKWRIGTAKNKAGNDILYCDYTGGVYSTKDLGRMIIQVAEDEFGANEIIEVKEDIKINIGVNDISLTDNVGSIRVKIYRVK
jgi:hypothetical protein